MALYGEWRRDDGLECGLVLAEGVWIGGVEVLDELLASMIAGVGDR